jgi:hypothetical protein
VSEDTRKIGEGHAAAMGRLGLRELRELGNPGGNVTQASEYGLYGSATPGEVAESRRHDLYGEQESPDRDSVLADRLQQAKDREVRDRDDRDRDDDSRGMDRD